MSYIVVDVEADEPIPSFYSMVCFGAVVVDDKLDKTFYGQTAPLEGAKWNPQALAVSGFTREEHENFAHPSDTMQKFSQWLAENSKGRPIFISDNNGFDWQFINFYMWKFQGMNPFGFSSRRIGDIYCGLTKNLRGNKEWKKFRKTRHSHNPVDDAKGNAEALLEMSKRYNIRF